MALCQDQPRLVPHSQSEESNEQSTTNNTKRENRISVESSPKKPLRAEFNGARLWVNHDAQQMKSHPHRRAVFSHVQKQYRRWRRHEDFKTLRESVKLPGRKAEQHHLLPAPPRPIITKNNSHLLATIAIPTPHHSQELSLRSPLHLARISNDSSRLDPMNALPIPAHKPVQHAVDYFLQVLAPQNEAFVSVGDHTNPHFTIHFPFLLQNAMCFEASVAIWRSLWLAAAKKPQEDRTLILHRGNALGMLRKSLQHNTDLLKDEVAMTVVYLLSVEMQAGSLEGIEAHLRAVQTIRELRSSRKDSSTTSQYVTGRLQIAEKVGCVILKGLRPDSPIFGKAGIGCLKYPRHPFSPQLCKNLSNLPIGLFGIAMSELLSFEMIEILVLLVQVREEMSSDQLEILATLQRVRTITINIRSLFPAPEIPDTEKYLFYGVWAFTINLDDQLQHPTNKAASARFLLKPFAQLQLPQPMPHRECVIWVYVSFAGATRFYDLSYSNRILDSLLRDFPECRDWECLEEIIRRFLWTETIISHWKGCWQEGMERRTRLEDCN